MVLFPGLGTPLNAGHPVEKETDANGGAVIMIGGGQLGLPMTCVQTEWIGIIRDSPMPPAALWPLIYGIFLKSDVFQMLYFRH